MDTQTSNVIDLTQYRERRRAAAAAAAAPVMPAPQASWPMMMAFVWVPCWVSMGSSVPVLQTADG